jgi:N-acetylmuramoyl-L-alanine amidase
MKPLSLLLACLAASALAAPAQVGLSKLERVPLYGRTYVRLDDWAEANRFTCRVLKNPGEVLVTNRWARLEFSLDSRRAEVDGVALNLSYPIAPRSGAAYITPLDLQTAIQPILFPPKNPPEKRVRTICLDPGHGGKDAGNLEGKTMEKHATLRIAQEVRGLLEDASVKVVMTRTSDTFIDLDERPNIARRRGADVMVSLHFNSHPGAGTGAKGVEVYCLTPAGAPSTVLNPKGKHYDDTPSAGNKNDPFNMLLAYQVQRSLVSNLVVEDRGVRRARFVVLKDAEMPAVLIEGGFMSHPTEGRKLNDPAYLKQMARAITDGILAYKRLVERSSGTSVAGGE